MEFPSLLKQGVLLKRHKRFLAEIVLNNQENRTIYCPNVGIMTGCDMLGSRIWFSHSIHPGRKFPDTWELVEVDAGHLVCINTLHTHPLLIEAIANGTIEELQGYTQMVLNPPPETGEEHYVDMLIERETQDLFDFAQSKGCDKCFIATNGVILGDEIHRGFFPDGVSESTMQQLKALIHAKQQGHRAVLMYCALNTGIERIFPADHIDLDYGYMLRQAVVAGVEILAYRATISLSEIVLTKKIEVCIPARMLCSAR